MKIPPNALVAVVTALLTSGLTLMGVWLTNKSNNQRLRIQLEHERLTRNEEVLRERLEEFYVVSNKYLDHLFTHYLPYRMVMRGQISFNKALDMTIEGGSKENYEPHRVSMLIDLYFKDIKPAFVEIMDMRSKLNSIVDGFKEQYKAGNTDGSKWLELFQPLYEELGKKCDEFEKHIINLKKT